MSHLYTVVGDLNCPDIDWVNFTSPSDGVQDVFLDFTVVNRFTQTVIKPTIGGKYP